MNSRPFNRSIAIAVGPTSIFGTFSGREAISKSANRRSRFSYLGFLSALCLAGLGLYIYSVNAIMLDGVAIRTAALKKAVLRDETTRLGSVALKSESPAWLTEASAAIGLIAVDRVHFLHLDSSFALSFQDVNSGQNQ